MTIISVHICFLDITINFYINEITRAIICLCLTPIAVVRENDTYVSGAASQQSNSFGSPGLNEANSVVAASTNVVGATLASVTDVSPGGCGAAARAEHGSGSETKKEKYRTIKKTRWSY